MYYEDWLAQQQQPKTQDQIAAASSDYAPPQMTQEQAKVTLGRKGYTGTMWVQNRNGEVKEVPVSEPEWQGLQVRGGAGEGAGTSADNPYSTSQQYQWDDPGGGTKANPFGYFDDNFQYRSGNEGPTLKEWAPYFLAVAGGGLALNAAGVGATGAGATGAAGSAAGAAGGFNPLAAYLTTGGVEGSIMGSAISGAGGAAGAVGAGTLANTLGTASQLYGAAKPIMSGLNQANKVISGLGGNGVKGIGALAGGLLGAVGGGTSGGGSAPTPYAPVSMGDWRPTWGGQPQAPAMVSSAPVQTDGSGLSRYLSGSQPREPRVGGLRQTLGY